MTTEKKSYAEKLKDPRWQQKRLQILKRDKWTCKICGDKTTTLHIHHEEYSHGKEPWDYPDTNLHTLCSDCHEFIEYEKKHVGEAPVSIFSAYKLYIDECLTYIIAVGCNLRIRTYDEDRGLIGDMQIDGPHLASIKKILNKALKVENLLSNG